MQMVFIAFSQSPAGLKEGQRLPDMTLGKDLAGRRILTRELAGKVVILDFWNIYCTSCVRGFPTMNALQKRFGKRIEILLVTQNSKEEVQKLFHRLKADVSNLKVLTDDTVLTRLFPHDAEPHHVWIDQTGIYQLASFDHNTTENNINRMLEKSTLRLASKKDGIFKDGESLLTQAVDRFPKQIATYSIFVKGLYPYTIGGSLAFGKDSANGFPDRFQGIGLSPLRLLAAAFCREVYGYEPGVSTRNSSQRLILDVANKADLYLPKDSNKVDQWQADNFLSYEIKIKPHRELDLYRAMQQDLSGKLPYIGSIESRRQRYLALVRTDQVDHLRSTGSGTTSFTTGVLDFQNVELGTILKQMNEYSRISKLPIVDKTGIKYRVDFRIASSLFYDLKQLQKDLNKQGLDLVEKYGDIPVLVIRDKKEDIAP